MLKPKKKSEHNEFISYTGYKTLLIFKLLLEKPQSLNELKTAFQNDIYLKNKIANDTIRTYINSLRSSGCEISKAIKATNNKFIMTNHPLEIDVEKSHIDALKKISNNIQNKNDIESLKFFEIFILKLISLVKNNDTIEDLTGILILNKLNKTIFENIQECCKKNFSTVLLYESAGKGLQELEIICNNIFFKSNNAYIAGYNTKYNEYSSLLINRIKKILDIKPLEKSFISIDKNVICEIYDTDYILDNEDNLILQTNDKLIVKMDNTDEFRTLQKILYLGKSCKILKPNNIKNKFKRQLLEMRKIYEK